MELKWTKFAFNSLKSIFKYYKENVNELIANNIKDEILSVTKQLEHFHLSGKKEDLLKMKLGLNLNKVHVKESKIHGNGLFASKDIKSGEIITFYPGDILVYYPDKNRDKINNVVGYIFSEELKDNKELNAAFNNNKKYYKDYQLVVNETYSIIGVPEINDNPMYLGHICNDGARGHTEKDKQIYEKVSVIKSNAYFKNICDCMMAVIAIKDIKKDDEILVTYGHGYWLSRNH
jgi:SET domain-containing protein